MVMDPFLFAWPLPGVLPASSVEWCNNAIWPTCQRGFLMSLAFDGLVCQRDPHREENGRFNVNVMMIGFCLGEIKKQCSFNNAKLKAPPTLLKYGINSTSCHLFGLENNEKQDEM